MKNKFSFLICLFLCIFSINLFADNYYICVSSFWNKSFAEKLVSDLEKEGISAVIEETQKDYDTYYRVLVNVHFDNPEEARKECKKLQSSAVIEDLDLENLWICKTENVIENKVEKTIQPVVLTTNQNNEIIVTEEKPYSILVNKYKESEAAENDKHRLKNQNIEAYILKTYDEKELFNFELHAGAFETEEETAELQKELNELGIEGTEVSDFNEIKDSIEKYNEIVKKENVVFEETHGELSEDFSEDVKECIRQFPVNRDFQIIELEIYDLKNARASNYKDIPDNLGFGLETNAVSVAQYRDDLFHKDITVVMFSGDEDAYKDLWIDNSINADVKKDYNYSGTIDFQTAEGKIECVLYEKDGDFILDGTNSTKSFQIILLAQDFTLRQFSDFLNNSFNDSSYLVYPQLRKSLFVLPKENPSVRRDFICFKFSKIGMDYAESKRYTDWSLAIVGHWCSDSVYNQENKLVNIGFFDLDYDFNAKQVHELFMTDKKRVAVSSFNHPVVLNDIEAWYLLMPFNGSNELSFATKSYIIAVDSYSSTGMISEDECVEVASDLQIWE